MGGFKQFLKEAIVDAPNGLFAKVLPITKHVVLLQNLFADFELNGCKLMDDLHATVIYTKDSASGISLPKVDRKLRFRAIASGVQYWDGHDNEGYIVLDLESEDLLELHKQFVATGLKPTFPDYHAHVTLVNPVPNLQDYELLIQRYDQFLKAYPQELQFYYGGYVIMDPKE